MIFLIMALLYVKPILNLNLNSSLKQWANQYKFVCEYHISNFIPKPELIFADHLTPWTALWCTHQQKPMRIDKRTSHPKKGEYVQYCRLHVKLSSHQNLYRKSEFKLWGLCVKSSIQLWKIVWINLKLFHTH